MIQRIGRIIVVATFAISTLSAEARTVRMFDTRVPMRDGVELSADIRLPNDTDRHPALLIRTPYINSLNPAPSIDIMAALNRYVEAGYALIYQDVRGRGDSDGEFDFYHNEAADGFDTIEWIARQPWSNGDVCMLGVSYLGAVQWLAAKEQPPHLKCIVPTAPSGQYFVEIPYSGGAWNMAWTLSWINGTSGRSAQGALLTDIDMEAVYQHRPLITMDEFMGRKMPLYQKFISHPTEDEYWQEITLGRADFENIKLPVMTVTGWFDGDQPGALYYWRMANRFSTVKDKHYLVIGPWNHVQTFLGGAPTIGEFHPGPASVLDNVDEHLEFYAHFLTGTAQSYDQPRVRTFLTGVNEWRSYDDYPPPEMQQKKLYLGSGGRANSLFGDGGLDWSAPGAQPTDSYTFDPKRPVPAIQTPASDLRPNERRDDVLVYTTETLREPVEILGQVWVELYAASDARDTDFVVNLVDVFPDGRAVRLGPVTGIVRARYRLGMGREELLLPGSVERYRIDLHDIGHRFLAGHKIRLEVTSSWYPAYNPNQNTGNPVATDTEWRVAEQTIYHDGEFPSAVILPVMPLD